MPEGDTIHRTAERLRRALVGKTVRRFESRRQLRDRPRMGQTVVAVEAVGKHLLIRFDGGLVLRTHMGMTGSWSTFGRGERWGRRHLARAVLEVDDVVAVCFAAPTIRTYREGQPSGIEHLGPDLTLPEPDIDEALRRMGAIADPSTEIADVMLDQRVAAGIGNAVKCEALWACRQHPFTPLAEVPPDRRRQLLVVAAKHLLAGTRTRRPEAVHGRRRRPCRACGTPIELARQGTRITFWCPTCQPDPGDVTRG